MLIPDNGDGPRYIPERIGDYTGVLTQQLGIGRHPAIGAADPAARRRRHGRRLRPPAASSTSRWPPLTVLSVATVSTHFRMVGRYYFQVLPWVLYFAAAAIVAAVQAGPRARGAPRGAASSPPCRCCTSSPCTLAVLPGDIGDARDFDDGGRQQIGPTDPSIAPIYDAVAAVHRADATSSPTSGPAR